MPLSRRRKQEPNPSQRRADVSEQEPPDRLPPFQTRLAAGDYYALIGPGLRRALRGAAADITLEAEIGALRLALAKLLQEEGDPNRLAAGVTRVVGVAVQVARLRNSAGADTEGFQGALLRELEAFEKEQALLSGQDQDQDQDQNQKAKVERQSNDAER